MTAATPGLLLEYVPCAGGARLVSLWGDDPCPVLPETAGGLPLAELGDYCFAPAPRAGALPPAALRRRALTPGAPCVEHRIAGGFLRGITLPDSLRAAGSCAFYDCRCLASLSVGAGPLALGSDVFVNTFALHEITVRAAPDAPTGLYALAGALSGDLRALFRPQAAVLAAARYPEYWEDIEETPAHILLHNYSGQGYHYRQCFADGAPRWEEYDAVFPQARAEDPPAAMALLALDRLRWPHALGAAAAAGYRAFLAAHSAEALEALRTAQDTESLRALLALGVLDAPALRAGAAAAAAADCAPFAALLTDALRGCAAGQTGGCRYSFDF